jgi:hypothetical protein
VQELLRPGQEQVEAGRRRANEPQQACDFVTRERIDAVEEIARA